MPLGAETEITNCSSASSSGSVSDSILFTKNSVLWNRNRNRRNRNFLTSGTGTGTVTCLKVGTGTGTVINYGSGTGTRHKIMYLISFIKHFFHSHFTINLLKFMNFFLVKQLTK